MPGAVIRCHYATLRQREEHCRSTHMLFFVCIYTSVEISKTGEVKRFETEMSIPFQVVRWISSRNSIYSILFVVFVSQVLVPIQVGEYLGEPGRLPWVIMTDPLPKPCRMYQQKGFLDISTVAFESSSFVKKALPSILWKQIHLKTYTPPEL